MKQGNFEFFFLSIVGDFHQGFSRAAAHHPRGRLISLFGDQEERIIRSIFRDKIISALNIKRYTAWPVFGGPASIKTQVLTLGHDCSIEAIPITLGNNSK